jgi:hypothetical protein
VNDADTLHARFVVCAAMPRAQAFETAIAGDAARGLLSLVRAKARETMNRTRNAMLTTAAALLFGCSIEANHPQKAATVTKADEAPLSILDMSSAWHDGGPCQVGETACQAGVLGEPDEVHACLAAGAPGNPSPTTTDWDVGTVCQYGCIASAGADGLEHDYCSDCQIGTSWCLLGTLRICTPQGHVVRGGPCTVTCPCGGTAPRCKPCN